MPFIVMLIAAKHLSARIIDSNEMLDFVQHDNRLTL